MTACPGEADVWSLSNYDLYNAVALLCEQSRKPPQELRQWLSQKNWSPSTRASLLDQLSQLLLRGDSTADLVAQLCCPLLPELLDRCARHPRHRKRLCLVLGRLAARFPAAAHFTEAYLKDRGCLPALLEGMPGEGHCEAPAAKRPRVETPFDVVCCCLQLLSAWPQQLRSRWDWSPLLPLLQHSSAPVRWYASQCLSLLLSLPAPAHHALLLSTLPKDQGLETELRLATEVALASLRPPTWPPCSESPSLLWTHSDLSAGVACISGLLLPRSLTAGNKPLDKALHQRWRPPSAERALRSLAECVSRGRPTLVRGPVGSGKTTLVGDLAARLGRPLLSVQLGDQADAHTLVGGYVCSGGAGRFSWREGPLARALRLGCWLLLEDLERASPDVSSLLLPVLQHGALPGLPSNPGFQLLATHREGGHRGGSGLLPTEALWASVTLDHPSREEMEQMIIHEWPQLEPLAGRLLDMLCQLRERGSPVRRTVSQRDLVKLCRRLTGREFTLEGVRVAEEAFQDAMDCLCQSVREPEQRLALAQAVGAKLGLPKAQVLYFTANHKPTILENSTAVTVGRVTLPRRGRGRDRESNSGVFAGTRPALALLEQLAAAVANREPVLLVGETGVGKTAAVQHLARLTGNSLTVLNMSQQSDSTDLLGGFKPVDVKILMMPLRDEFEQLFAASFCLAPNAKFLSHVTTCFSGRHWQALFRLMRHSQQCAMSRLSGGCLRSASDVDQLESWRQFGRRLEQVQLQVQQAERGLAFAFVEGALVRALETGAWVLLDEINLAEGEALESLAPVLDGSSPVLFERGDQEPVPRHPNFRLFACMNPATDVGKKDLPAGIRSRFTEVYLEEPLDACDLELVADAYLGGGPTRPTVELYLDLRRAAQESLADGTGRRPHYSLRTLCRALRYAAGDPCGSWAHSLYQGFCLSFLTALDRGSHPAVESLIHKRLIGQKVPRSPAAPLDRPSVQLEGYWVALGPLDPVSPEGYVLTTTVRRNLRDLARAAACGRHPVLLQGETSAGKTSLVRWLAARTGHVCMRLNNHEHTDLEEYLGSYGAEPGTGRLVFREGVLVEAMRKGHWIVLDELNLACSEILEALNRVLDDNRELFVPETQETIRAHPHFMLFATQNPPGRYGGRKVLSRAFRNRFLELHFEELPPEELAGILNERCKLPPSYGARMVAVMCELQLRRRETGVFAGRHGYMTLRDLFRWAERYRRTESPAGGFFDWNQYLAEEGYALLAGRVRRPQEEQLVSEVLAKHFKCKVDPERLFSRVPCKVPPPGFSHLVWTADARRLAALLERAWHFEEPVLLVGDTGCGKTTLCELWAALQGQRLRSVSCHLHSEAGDLLGGLRPGRQVGGPLFEWADGPLVEAMARGDAFLVDEINLAEDAVLERLNSLLEPERTLLLPEEGGRQLVAHPQFRLLATMNPGGDFGKRELSPALRNRFTEIWCPSTVSSADLAAIADHNLGADVRLGSLTLGAAMADFLDWIRSDELGHRCVATARDVLAWADLIKRCTSSGATSLAASYVHGARLAFLDGLGTGTSRQGTGRRSDVLSIRVEAALLRALWTAPETRSLKWDALQTIYSHNEHTYFPEKFTHIWGGRSLRGVKVLHLHTSCQCHIRCQYDTARYCGTSPLMEALPRLVRGAPHISLVAVASRRNGELHTSKQVLSGVPEILHIGIPALRAVQEGREVWILSHVHPAWSAVVAGPRACAWPDGALYIAAVLALCRRCTRLVFGNIWEVKNSGGEVLKLRCDHYRRLAIRPRSRGKGFRTCMVRSPGPETIMAVTRDATRAASTLDRHRSWCSLRSPWAQPRRRAATWPMSRQLAPMPSAARASSRAASAAAPPAHGPAQVPPAQPELWLDAVPCSCRGPSGDPADPLLGGLSAPAAPRGWVPRALSGRRREGFGPGFRWKGGISAALLPRGAVENSGLRLGARTAAETAELTRWRRLVDLSKKVDEVLGHIEERLNGLLRQAASPRPSSGLQQLMAASSQIHAAWPSRTSGQDALLRRLGDLRRLLSGLPQDSGWTDVLTELEQLEKEAAHPEFLGGRFEWRDSVLVTSLIRGDWLLLENVNLCSASVLDRLNGLLEPDGVLPLTEQGVVGEALRVVRPHPDFRLIMTMDPRHGEISRAMRNRTVEVYLPGEEDGGTLDLWDTQALLASAGLLQPGLSGPLYEAHRAFSAASAHGRKATLTNLKQAVALSVHRLESGVLPFDAVRSSFAETHLVAWDSREAEVACQSLEGVSWKGTQLPQAQQLLLSLVASPPLWALERHCEAAQIWSDSLALCAVLATLSEPSRVVLPTPLELQGVEPQSLLGMATRLLLEPCTHNNLSLRISWLQHMARSFGYPPELEPFLRRFTNCCTDGAGTSVGVPLRLEDLPLDLYQCPDLLARLWPCGTRDEEIRASSLWLQLLLRQWDLEARLPTLVEPRDPKTPRLGDPLSRMLAAFIDWLLGGAPVEEIYSKARLAQEHIERLWQACSEPDSSHCLTAPRSARIAQHWSWLRKALSHLTPHKDARTEDDSDSPSLASTVARVDQCLLDHLALHQHKLRNRVAKRLGQPRPLREEESAVAFEKACGLAQRVWELARGCEQAEASLSSACALEKLPALEGYLIQLLRGTPNPGSQDLLTTLEKELLPVEEDNEKTISRAAVSPVDALRDLVQLVEESPALESFLEGRTEGSPQRGALWHPLHGAASALALGKDLQESNREPLLGEVSAWWVEHLCGLWDTPTHLGIALAQSIGWQDGQTAAGWLEGHQVYLSPLMTVTCCAMADGPGFHLGLGDRTPKCAELEAQRRLLARGTDPRTLWTSQAATLEQWFSQLVSTLPGFAGREGDWWIQLDIPEEFRLLVRDAAQQLQALADSRPWSPERLWSLGLAWARVGLCSLQLLVPWDPVDPVYKVALKVAHVEKELSNRDAEQCLRHWAHRAHTGKPPCLQGHPAFALEAARRQQLATQLRHLCARKAHRGPNSQARGSPYEELARQMRHCAATLGSKERVEAVLRGLENARQGSCAPGAEARSCLAAQEATVRRLRLEHPTFRDLCYPFLCGLAQMAQGIRVLATLASSRSCTSKDTRRELVLCQGLMFPTGMSPKAVSDLLCSSQASTLASSGSQQLLLLRSALLELVNGRLSDHAGTMQWLRAARPVFGQLVHAWQQNEEEERQKQEKERSLYQYRCHAGEPSQEELDEQQRRALFPCYAEEFEEEKDVLETKEQPCAVPPAAFGDKEASEVWRCHAVLADPGKPLGSVDWLGALELRCRALRESVRQLGPSLDPQLDLELLGSHMVSCWSLEQRLRAPEKNAAEEAVKGRQFDLYHDGVLEEMALCERPLRCIMARAEALLEQFPGHPGLTRLLQVCKRVLSLEVSSPLMRVLQGLEMLLVVGQEWENGAHRNISLSAELNEITQLVVRWRKLELQGWSRCLDSVQQKRRDGQARWWFFLHQLLAPLIQKSKSSLDDKTRQRVGDELVRFLGECRLGDLESRLDLVWPFLHEALASGAPLRGLLFNLCHFYGQYLPVVQARIQRDREPIEKKLKEYVRIVRWKDISFWAIKQTVEKSHRVLHSHMKDFQLVLDQEASCTFEAPPQRQEEDGERGSLFLDLKPRQFLGPVPSKEDGVPRYARRMRQLLGRVLRNDALAELTLELDQLAGQVVATVLDFEKQDAMLGRPGPKGDPEADKRRQQARLAQQLKRKALADLLKALAQLGLSHRKGQLRGATPRSMLEAPALELSATLRDGAAGAALESNWQGCHSYYYRSVAGLSTLAASCPSKELDPQLMDRCCGFAAHLATLAVEDRTRSCEVLANLEKLRALSTSVELAAKGPLPPQTFLDHWKGKVAATLSQAAVQLDQVLVLLRAWPRDEAAPVQATELAVGRLQAHLAPLEQCARLLALPATRGLLGHPEPDLLKATVQQLAALSRDARQSSDALCPPLARHLWALAEPLDVLAGDWAQARAPNPDGEAPPSDALARRLLVAVQRLHGHLGGAPGDPALGPHLTLLRDNLQEAFVRMDLERTCKLTGRLVRHLHRHGVDENSSRACDAVVPLLRQYLGACRYLASLQLAAHRSGLKLLHILASLFSTLAKKGLCLPEEWREELEREGAPELQELEDGGLGEGEGAKDVSDRIESQDQLEGTRSEQKEEPEEEQRAPKDEEHGVEMTEDFEAPAQDPEEGEGEEGDESEEEDKDELDDQMGDVQGDDQLDQELWDKEEQEESKEEEEEVAAEGESCAEEPQLGARDEDAAPQREEPAGAPPDDEKAPDDGPEVAPEGPPEDSTIGEPPDPQEPEPLNLPEDMQLGSDAEDAEGEEPQEAPPPETVEEAKEEGEDQATEDKMEQGEEEGEGTQEGAPPPIDMQNLDGAVPEAEDGGTDGTGASHGATPQGASTEEHGPQEKESEQGGGPVGGCAEVGTGQSDADANDPGTSLKTSHERSLADKEENEVGKRLHTVDSRRAPKEASETFRHVEDDEAHDEVALDTATLDQTQGGIERLEEEQVPETLRPESPQEETPEPPQESTQRERASGHQQPSAGEDPVPREGPVAETAHVERGPEASFHTRMDVLEGEEEEERARAPEPGQELCSAESHAWAAWEEAERAVAPLVTELCEQLRLVLEPTRASRLRGDFRSGKRLSMRRVIAYLASQLRRDKMWLRRVQPSQRQYRVLLAVDDSLSMGPSGPLALQSLALLAQALSLLEAGELAVASFGESVRLLHPLGRPWTREAGANVAGALGFNQGRTRVAPLLRAAEALLPAGPDAARLVLLVSDGRGICSEGDVAAAVRDAHSLGLLMVFLVLDCLGGKDSILEVRKPEFGPSGEVRLRSYMEHFPFPFYLLLRDLASMPAVLGEALRQWLELVAQA
ncbi:unnamed protein product [Ixodes persulcatus]